MFTQRIHPNEELLEVYRKHELILLPKIIEIFLLIFIPWYLGIKYGFVFESSAHTKIFLLATFAVGLYAAYIFIVWTVNQYLVTTKRLIHITQSGLFKKLVTETPLDRILNVSFRTTGILSTIFGYGDVLVQIVGLEEPLVLRDVPRPSEVKDFLWKMHSEYSGEQKITYTTPEIASVDTYIPYAPSVQEQKINKRK